jgi:type IX secretion system substrate protein/BNR repeat protein
MKRKSFFLLLILNSQLLLAQWQPDVRLTNDSGESYTSRNNAWCIAASGNVVHVVWYDNRDGNNEIYYKRSMDEGVSWGADTRLTNASSSSRFPSISISGSVAHVVWWDIRDVNPEIYYKRSTDGGVSWGPDTRLTNNPSESIYPSVSVSGSVVHVVWTDYRDGHYEIYYKRSTDEGVSWGTDIRLMTGNVSSYYPFASVTVSGSVVHIVWTDYLYEIHYKRSTDGGVSWGPDIRLNTPAFSILPSVSVSGSSVHVAWTDYRDGNFEIYYKHSTDGGVSWGTDTRLTNDTSASGGSSVTVSGSAVHVVWFDNRDGNYEIYYKRSTDGGLGWGPDTRMTNNPSESIYPSVSVSGSVVHVVWRDTRDGNPEIYYKRNPTGNPIGIQNISSEVAAEFKLGQNYPNPFNASSKFIVQISKLGNVKITVYDMTGREIQTLVNQILAPGTYEVEWDGANFSSGVYYYRLNAEEFTDTKKMVLLK